MTRTTCPYCGVGCGVERRGETIVGDAAHPANRGRLCIKGQTLAETLDDGRRLRHPRVGGRDATWDEALDVVAARFGETIARHGPDSVAFYVSGQFLTEDYYAANKLMKGFIGSGNIDTNSRLCMASAVAGHVRAFGEDVVPGCYEDLEEADLILLVGSNMAWCHPVLFERVVAARAARGTTIIAIDPRATATTALADLHVAIDPDRDAQLFAALLAELAGRGAVDHDFVAAHATGWDACLDAARGIDPARCGVDAASFATLADLLCRHERTVTVFSQGVNQSACGTDKVSAILNLHLATGRIGKPGATPFSVTGQPNAMGGREVGGLANQLAGHMRFDDPGHHDAVRTFWNAPRLARHPGLNAVDMFDAVLSGGIKAIWIAATNPADSMPRADRVRAALEICPFVVAADAWETATTQRANVVLPAAAWSEKDGTVTNSERVISRQRRFRPSPGEAKPDWWMFAEVARRLGHGAEFAWRGPADLFREHAALSAFRNEGARRFDIGDLAAIDDAAYDALAPRRWGAARLFADGRFPTEDGRARMVPVGRTRVDANPAFPFVLNTGRLRDQWHTMTRTGEVPRLLESAPAPALSLAASDAERLGARPGDLVRVASREASTLLPVAIDRGLSPGQVFAPMHWTASHSAGDAIDRLVGATRDPRSGQPALKAERVALEILPARWHGVLHTRARPALAGDFHWSRVPRPGGFHVVRLTGWKALPAGRALAPWAARIARGEDDDGAPATHLLELADPARSTVRVAVLRGDRLDAALFIAATADALPDGAQISALFTRPAPLEAGLALLRPEAGVPARVASRAVCVCHGVDEATILSAVQRGLATDVASVGACTRAGTNCGSCKGEIAMLIAQSRAAAARAAA